MICKGCRFRLLNVYKNNFSFVPHNSTELWALEKGIVQCLWKKILWSIIVNIMISLYQYAMEPYTNFCLKVNKQSNSNFYFQLCDFQPILHEHNVIIKWTLKRTALCAVHVRLICKVIETTSSLTALQKNIRHVYYQK